MSSTDERPPRPWASVQRWVSLGVAVLVSALVISGVGVLLAALRVASVRSEVTNHLRPAQLAVAAMSTAYVDEETGQRGYMLTGDNVFLQPYDTGRATLLLQSAVVAAKMGNDRTALSLLDDVTSAGLAWRIEAAQPQIDARVAGPIPPAQLLSMTIHGKQLFDGLRAQLNALTNYIDGRLAAELRQRDSAQSLSDKLTAVALSLAVVVGVACLVFLRLLLRRPLNRLIGQVQAVADGAYEQPIDSTGPEEVAQIAAAVETMRTNLNASAARLAEAESHLALQIERDRIAAGLHDRTINRVFGHGLVLGSVAAKNPSIAPDLEPLIDETDQIIRELRSIIAAIKDTEESTISPDGGTGSPSGARTSP